MNKFIVWLEVVCSSLIVGIYSKSFMLGQATFFALFAIIIAIYDKDKLN